MSLVTGNATINVTQKPLMIKLKGSDSYINANSITTAEYTKNTNNEFEITYNEGGENKNAYIDVNTAQKLLDNDSKFEVWA